MTLFIVTLSFSSVAFRLAIVHVGALSAGVQSRLAVDMNLSTDVILVFTWSTLNH